jgi:hypothetical protein
MKIVFEGSLGSDGAANDLILEFLASRKGTPVTARQVWRSLRARGFVPTDGRRTAHADPDDGAAIAEISRRLQRWRARGTIGGEADPESLTGDRHFWSLESAPKGA